MAYNFPPNPSLNETYTSNGRTFRWNGVQWVAVITPTSNSASVFVSASAPPNPVKGALWFNTIDQTLYVRISTQSGEFWTESYPGSNPQPASNPPVKISSSVPSNSNEGDLWFNPNLAELRVKINGIAGATWELVGGYSPAQPAKVEVSVSPPDDPEQGSLWLNSSNGELYVWVDSQGGGFWDSVSSESPADNMAPVFSSVSEPLGAPLGYLWFNPSDNSLKVRSLTPSGPNWEPISTSPIPPQFAKVRVSVSPPTSFSEGDLWFNTSDNSLYVRIEKPGGGYWGLANEVPEPVNSPSIRISSSPPANPVQGDLWYDPDDSTMSIWYEDLDSSQWVAVVPYPEEYLSLRGGTLSGPIYAGYDIPYDSNAFVTVGWVENVLSQQSISPSILSGKGSLITATSAGVASELKVGQNGEFLKADSTAEAGLTWSNNVDCGAF